MTKLVSESLFHESPGVLVGVVRGVRRKRVATMASSEQTHQRSVTSRPSKQILSTADHPVLQPRQTSLWCFRITNRGNAASLVTQSRVRQVAESALQQIGIR